MRFKGRVRFDGKGSDDLDVMVEVDDSHVRLLSGDESLGRWCLADVVANRRVANEFELDLDGEVVTFLADDQVNFAYGAVQQMAEGWARYHSMNPVRRRRAVGAARRGNEPSRLGEVRRTLVAAREELRRLPAAATETAAPPDEMETASDPAEEPSRQPAPSESEPELETAEEGLWARVERVSAGTAPEVRAVEEVEQEEPRQTPIRGRPRLAGRLPRIDTLSGVRRSDSEAVESEPGRIPEPESEPEPEPESEPEPEPESEPEPDSEPDPKPDPKLYEEADDVEADTVANGHRHRRGLDSRAYAGGHHPAETTGIRASMRSLFARSKPPQHEHSFVQTTTLGITRRVCIDCGHVSIGVDD